ncbi:hypothetical protein QQY66_49090 [Streptomyces sp. DG2A-72]|uniref:hypothetical protein n=1 Tax=Streptomyces sp. DG2A-72 TaxID=3051386 RepID=UPI00265BB52A|nr:hypothetical protein [Streptomyces sp. DG2A-72]MDO0939270.1 hypothetical protein [Streptomyces sp. DG2A-72]
MTAVRRRPRRALAGLAAAIHHLIVSRTVLTGLVIGSLLALAAGHRTLFALALAAAALVVIVAVRAESRPRYAACPLCARPRRGTRKEHTK